MGSDADGAARVELTSQQMIWAAISRALRTPSSVDASMVINVGAFDPPGGYPVTIRILGNPAIQNEELLAYEAGYRAATGNRFTFDLSAYYNNYDHLETTEPGRSFLEMQPRPWHIVLPQVFGNRMHGEAHGIELSGRWKINDRWSLTPSYAFEGIHLHAYPNSLDHVSVADSEGSSPSHWVRLDSHVSLGRALFWDASANFVGRLKYDSVPSYTRCDTQLTWSATENMTLSVAGQNLCRDRHLEFVSDQAVTLAGLAKRSMYAKIAWRF